MLIFQTYIGLILTKYTDNNEHFTAKDIEKNKIILLFVFFSQIGATESQSSSD